MNDRLRSQEMAKRYKNMIGNRYRHFKGNIYTVTDISVHSETSEVMVIYKNEDSPELVWARPFKMFISHVDKEKYPDVKQEMRFELIKEKEIKENVKSN